MSIDILHNCMKYSILKDPDRSVAPTHTNPAIAGSGSISLHTKISRVITESHSRRLPVSAPGTPHHPGHETTKGLSSSRPPQPGWLSFMAGRRPIAFIKNLNAGE